MGPVVSEKYSWGASWDASRVREFVTFCITHSLNYCGSMLTGLLVSILANALISSKRVMCSKWESDVFKTTGHITVLLLKLKSPISLRGKAQTLPWVWSPVALDLGFPGGTSGNELECQWRRQQRWGFEPGVGKIPWRREWQPTLIFLPGESHGQRSLAGCGPQGHTGLDTSGVTCMHTHPWIWPGITGIPPFFFFFKKFCERATLVSVFDWWKKPEEDSWRWVNFAFSICFAAATRKVAHTQSRECPPQAPSPETTLSLSGSGHQSSDQAPVLYLDLYGASLSKMCPRVIASSPYAVSVYKTFVGTFSFWTAGKPLFSGTFSLSATLVSLVSPW